MVLSKPKRFLGDKYALYANERIKFSVFLFFLEVFSVGNSDEKNGKGNLIRVEGGRVRVTQNTPIPLPPKEVCPCSFPLSLRQSCH